MIIEGRNAVGEALKGNTTIEKVMVLRDGNPALGKIIAECKKQGIKLVDVDKDVLDKYSSVKNNQGVIAFTTDFKYCTVDDILSQSTDESKLIVILDGISDPHNLGAVIRICDSVKADGIIIGKNRCCGVTDTAVKVSSGAAAYVKIAKVTNINDEIRKLKDSGVWVLSADMDGQSVYKTDLTGDIAVIIGSEGEGVHSLTKKLSDGVISLPQRGNVNSLNASIAAGAILYECVRQRTAK